MNVEALSPLVGRLSFGYSSSAVGMMVFPSRAGEAGFAILGARLLGKVVFR